MQNQHDRLPTWLLVLIILVFSAVLAWDILLDVGRMGFFWGWWGR